MPIADSDAKTSRGRGGQLSISPLRASRLLAALAGGNYVTVSCKYAGVTHPTYRNWITTGEREMEGYRLTTGQAPEDTIGTWMEGLPGDVRYSPDWAGWTAEHPAGFAPEYWHCVLFAFMVDKAHAEAEVTALARIQIAAKSPNHWQAAMTFLERRHPERWSRRDRLQVGGTPGQPVQVQQVGTDELVARIMELSQQAAQQASPAAPMAGQVLQLPVGTEDGAE